MMFDTAQPNRALPSNWYVITGGPSSGKTTLIEQLAEHGYLVAPEIAREYIEQLLAHNRTLDSIKNNERQVQKDILTLALEREQNLDPKQMMFFDRGVADSLGYYKYYHLDETQIIEACQRIRYKKVFYCHQLPVAADKVRIEDLSAAQEIGSLIYQSYQQLGYDLIELPAIPVEERLALILANIERSKE